MSRALPPDRAVAASPSSPSVSPLRASIPSAGPTCTFAEMVPLFQELFDPSPAHLTALIGRMKNLLRLGVAKGGHTTKGKAAQFTCEDLRDLLMITELCSIGITPAKAIKIYDRYKSSPDFVLGAIMSIQIDGRRCLQVDDAFNRDAARRHLPWMFTGRREQ